MTPEKASEIISRFFAKRNRDPMPVALGIYLCDYCDIWTDAPEKHKHGETPLD
jgi:hypothetical protein